MRAVPIIQALAAIALLAIPVMASAAPDQNSNPNQQNGCGYYNSNRQWVSTPCNNGNNGQWNNGQWNNGQNGQWNNGQNGRGNRRDGDRDDQRGNGRGGWNQRGNGQAGNRANELSGSVSSFSPYNLYLNNGTHVELHNGTVISPTGTNLVRGQRVVVRGNWNSDGSYNANEIDVVNNNGYNTNGYNGYNNGYNH